MSGPSIARHIGGPPPAEVQAETGAQRARRERIEAEIARDLGLCRPYKLGARIGECPGSAEYGHGMTLTRVHGGRCCEAWETARRQRLEALGE